jgi:hypothetical protein
MILIELLNALQGDEPQLRGRRRTISGYTKEIGAALHTILSIIGHGVLVSFLMGYTSLHPILQITISFSINS